MDDKRPESASISEDLLPSRGLMRALIDAIPDIVYIKDVHLRNQIVNKAFVEAFGLSQEAVAGKTDEEILPADLAAACRKSDEIVRTSGKPYRFEERSVGPDGVERDFETIKAPIFDDAGRVTGQVGVSRDITEQKNKQRTLEAALTEKEVLLKEIHHRVKNNMQVISSLLNLQSRYLKHPDDVELFKDSQNRIRSMAFIHEKLYQSKSFSRIEFGGYIKSLVESLRQSHQKERSRVNAQLESEEIFLDIQTAIPCGLIVNELVSNALRHAFPGERGGEVVVGLHCGEDGAVHLTVRDDGVGLPLGFNIRAADSMGMQLVTMLADQIDGTIEVDRSRGTEFHMAFRELKPKPRI